MPTSRELPSVTIITPCLNRAVYIEDVISSVAQQSYERIDHIVVDGGSTDGTQDVLREMERSYRFRWISEPDDGMYNAINKGLALSEGNILAYLNSDDLYLPWTVEVAVTALSDNPDAAMVYGDMAIVDEEGRVALSLYPRFNAGLLGRSAFLGQPTVFFRRSVLERVGGFDESLRYVADCDYWLRVGAALPVLGVEEIMAVQRDHAETLRSSQREALETEIRSVRSRYQPMDGVLPWLYRIADRLFLFFDRRYRLLRFLRALRRNRRDPSLDGPWCRFLREGDGFAISRSHVLLGLIPFAGRAMLFRMGKARGPFYRSRSIPEC